MDNTQNDSNSKDKVITDPKEIKREILEIIFLVILAVGIAMFIVNFVGQRTVVRGSSMVPTLHDGDQLINYKFIYLTQKPQKGDIVIIFVPENKRIDKNEKYYIKRVIATEGDTVEVKDKTVYLNGKMLEETSVVKEGGAYPEIKAVTVPLGYAFVMGDNRVNSRDSRELGFIPYQDIKGKAILRLWPLFDANENPYSRSSFMYRVYDFFSESGSGFGKLK